MNRLIMAANKISEGTVIPISLIIVILACTIHITVIWSKMMTEIRHLADTQATISDMQQYARQTEQNNPGHKAPDVLTIIQQRKSIYESVH